MTKVNFLKANLWHKYKAILKHAKRWNKLSIRCKNICRKTRLNVCIDMQPKQAPSDFSKHQLLQILLERVFRTQILNLVNKKSLSLMRVYGITHYENRTAPKHEENPLQQRMNELFQLLSKNNAQFIKALPSQESLKQILQHCYNCYDQLDFITLEAIKNQIACLAPKFLAEKMQKIMRVTKHLVRNVKCWLQSYSIDILRKVTQERSKDILKNNIQSACKICKRNFQELALRDARQQILGPSNWRQLFETELLMDEQSKKQEQIMNSAPDTEYMGAVNYLAKVIKDMENTSQGYEHLENRIQKDFKFSEDKMLVLLEDVLGRLKNKLGAQYKEKQSKIIKKLLSKVSSTVQLKGTSQTFVVSGQLDMIVNKPFKKSRAATKMATGTPPEECIEKLRQENRKLTVQRNSIGELYASTQEVLNGFKLLNNKTMSKFNKKQDISISQLARDSLARDTNDNRQSSDSSGIGSNTKIVGMQKNKRIGPAYSIQTKQSMKQSLIKRISLLHMKKTQTNKSELNQLFDRAMGEQATNVIDWEKYLANLELQNTEQAAELDAFRSSIQEENETNDIGVQWDAADFAFEQNGNRQSYEKERDKIVRKTRRFEKKNTMIYQNSQKKFNQVTSKEEIRTTAKNESQFKRRHQEQRIKTQAYEEHSSNVQSFHRTEKSTLKQKKTKKENQAYPSSKFKVNKPQTASKQTTKNLLNSSKQNLHGKKLVRVEDKNKNTNTSLQHLDSKFFQSNSSLNKERHTFGTTLKAVKMQAENDDKKEPVQLLRALDKNKNVCSISRITTEGNERATVKKQPKMVTSSLFKPEHLSIFGGVSQSFTYQNEALPQSEQILDKNDKIIFTRTVKHIDNLKGFKRAIYENTVYFLSRPFDTIEKNQFQFKQISKEKLNKLVLKLLLLHKKKCNSLSCEHMQSFSNLIGLNLE